MCWRKKKEEGEGGKEGRRDAAMRRKEKRGGRGVYIDGVER